MVPTALPKAVQVLIKKPVSFKFVKNFKLILILNVYDIANADRLGVSEVQLVQMAIDGVNFLIAMEKKLEAGEKIDGEVDRLQQRVKQSKNFSVQANLVFQVFVAFEVSAVLSSVSPNQGCLNGCVTHHASPSPSQMLVSTSDPLSAL